MEKYTISMIREGEKPHLFFQYFLPVNSSTFNTESPRGFFPDRDQAIERLSKAIKPVEGATIEIFGAEREFLGERLKQKFPGINFIVAEV
jgi:hypothetical protein